MDSATTTFRQRQRHLTRHSHAGVPHSESPHNTIHSSIYRLEAKPLKSRQYGIVFDINEAKKTRQHPDMLPLPHLPPPAPLSGPSDMAMSLSVRIVIHGIHRVAP